MNVLMELFLERKKLVWKMNFPSIALNIFRANLLLIDTIVNYFVLRLIKTWRFANGKKYKHKDTETAHHTL